MVYTEAEVAAPPEEVRAVFFDFSSLPQWHNALFQSITPANPEQLDIKEGDQMNVVVSHLSTKPTVIKNTSSEFRWYGSTFWGLISGEHYWLFQPSVITPGGTTLVHGEDYMGPIWFLFNPGWPLHAVTAKMYDQFTKDLKSRVESLHARG